MGFSHHLVSGLYSVKYCAFSVGEKAAFRIICGTPPISSTICPHNSSLSLSLSPSPTPISAQRTKTGSAFYHTTSPYSLHSLHCYLHWIKQQPALANCPFTWPQATDNHSSSHAHNTILIQGVGTIFIDQYRGYYCYVHTMDIGY